MASKADEPQAPGTVVRLKAWPKSVKPEDQDGGQLDKLTKAELIDRADEAGIDASGTKADIIERLESGPPAEQDAGADEAPASDGEPAEPEEA